MTRASAFSTAIAEIPKGRPGIPCPVESVLVKIDRRSAADVVAAFADRDRFTGPQIQGALDRMGHKIDLQAIGKHRRQQCRCYR